MGYCIEQRDSKFFIDKKYFNEALVAVKSLAGKKMYDDDYLNADSLADAIGEWRWDVTIDTSGNIVDIEFLGEKLGDDKILFDVLAPFVKTGSYIEIQGEDGELWRWVFDGEKCNEVYAEITW